MGLLRLAVLGPPEAFHDGSRLTFALRKAQALLLYLAVEGGMHSRSKLAAFLWPDSEPHDARTALRNALETPYIVQRRIDLEREAYPSYVDGRVVVAERMVDTAPYVGHGEFVDGCLTRLSTAALLNVTAGGGSQVPTFVVERR